MLKQHLFVNIMMLMQVGAIFSYTYNKNYGLSLYWLSCLLINYVVTYVIGR